MKFGKATWVNLLRVITLFYIIFQFNKSFLSLLFRNVSSVNSGGISWLRFKRKYNKALENGNEEILYNLYNCYKLGKELKK